MSKLDQIEAFAVFLDFLSNPDEYRQLVEDVRQAAEDHRKIMEEQRQIRDIDNWRASEEARLLSYQNRLDDLADEHAKRVEALKAKVANHALDVSEANKAFRKREDDLKNRETEVSKLELERKKVNQQKEEYEAKMNALRNEKDRLKQQAEQIKKAAGVL
jgi:chromosome segregation ATPase